MDGSAHATLASLSVVDVTVDNIGDLECAIRAAISGATFIAIDTELTGLGSRAATTATSVDDRYRALMQSASTRALVSLGVACFKKHASQTSLASAYDVAVFNIYLLCQEDHVVEPKSLRFLANNGFDFNTQITKGLPYWPGNDARSGEKGRTAGARGSAATVRSLFSSILRARIPVVLHNGLIDLAFVHHHFIAALPQSLATFTADAAALYGPSKLYDTKYIAEFKSRHPASFLDYLFRKALRQNRRLCHERASHVSLFSDGKELSLALAFPREAASSTELAICEQYACHGFCAASTCAKSHCLDRILDAEEQKAAARRSRKRRRSGRSVDTDGAPLAAQSPPAETGMATESVPDAAYKADSAHSHRAGFDAFMTGFVFAVDMAVHGEAVLQDSANRVCLSGKSFPLVITRSAFTSVSPQCKDKLQTLNMSTHD